MKKLLLIIPALILAGMFFYACQDTSVVEATNNPGNLNLEILCTPEPTAPTNPASGGNGNCPEGYEFSSGRFNIDQSLGYPQTGSFGPITWTIDEPGKELSWSGNVCGLAVIIKGGNGAYEYTYGTDCKSGTGLIAPMKNGNILNISNITFCWNRCAGDCQEETAFGGNSAGAGNSWWFYYDASIGGLQDIWAGQLTDVGNVEVVAGVVNIALTDGWALQSVNESVKIKGYNDLPNKRPAAGQFTGEGTYKGSNLTSIDIGIYSYYVIHLDVELCD